MIDLEKIGKKIASMRRERGYTGEELAERLHVSPQAVSKWENARCLPETAILPSLADALDCSIDSLLYPRELFILEAIYTDGKTHIPITHFINGLVHDNTLNICVTPSFTGVSLESTRLKLLTVKFQTPKGVYFSYALQNETLFLNKESSGFTSGLPFQLVGAYYGNDAEHSSAMGKMEHYEYFKWDKIEVNHENFPSSTGSDNTEYLTLIYLNASGIHTISCPENETLFYNSQRTQLLLPDHSKCILKNIDRLSWEKGMDCPWAGAIFSALKYMGETYSYHQLMGMSGACYRVCFADVWDFSCTDALVAFDYASPLSKAIGYSFYFADRLAKEERKAERQAIMEDIQNGKPVLAINLRVAPEWGIITGYTCGGSRLLCRTYFDQEVFSSLEREEYPDPEEKRTIFEENGGYLFNDFWPFLILHLNKMKIPPAPLDNLKASLSILISSFHAEDCRGYHQGKKAYQSWIKALSKDSDFQLETDRENVLRRLSVNDNMLCCLIDSRQAAAAYLREAADPALVQGREQLEGIAANCQAIADMLSVFRHQLKHSSACRIAYSTVNAFGASTLMQRKEQMNLLENACVLDEESCRLAGQFLESQQM